VLEKWICPSLFVGNGTSELEAVSAYVKQKGMQAAIDAWQRHWNDFFNESDLQWLSEHNVTSIRIPIGYFTAGFCRGTPFEPFQPVYALAWRRVREIIEMCNKARIAVLVDVHALPGGANTQDHSGTNSGKAEFWNGQYNDLTMQLLVFLTRELVQCENVCGIQIINEADWGKDEQMKVYYGNAINTIRNSGGVEMPVYVSDGWNTGPWVQFTRGQHDVVLDVHRYCCFQDQKEAPQWHIDRITDIDSCCVIGEFSLCFDGATWAHVKESDQPTIRQQFAKRQLQAYTKGSGLFFWTYKFEAGAAGDWDFRWVMDNNAFHFPKVDSQTADAMQKQYDGIRSNIVNGHLGYWKDKGGDRMNNKLFIQGFEEGWQDAMKFLPDESILASGERWVKTKDRQRFGQDAWLYEHGIKEAVDAFKGAVLAEVIR